MFFIISFPFFSAYICGCRLVVGSRSTVSIRIVYSVKERLERLKRRLGMRTINDVIVLLLEHYENKHKSMEVKGQ